MNRLPLIKIILTLLVLVTPCMATITYVQGGTSTTGTAHAASCSTAGSVASGDLVVMLSKYQGTAASMAGSTTSGPSIPWTNATSLFNANPGWDASVSWGIAPTSGTETATATWTGGTDGGFMDCSIAVFHSTTGWFSTPLDVQVSTVDISGGMTACVPGTTATTTNANDLVVGACFNFNTAQTYGTVSGYTFQSASSRNTTALYWAAASAVGPQTISVPTAGDVFTGFLLTFKANGAATPPPQTDPVVVTHYVSTSGSDSNNGTSTATPWLHAKGMSGCTGNCSSYSPAAGDRIVLRGGDVWHWNAASGTKGLPWTISGTGTTSKPIYYGVDHTWFNAAACGASWCRPVLNGDNPTSTTAVSSCNASDATNTVLLDDTTTWGVIDDFEMTGMCWSDATIPFFDDSYIAIDSTNGTYSNIYIHGWTHTAAASSQATAWIGSTDGRVTHFDSIVVDGSDSDPESLCSLCFDVYDVHNSVFRFNSNFVGNGAHMLYNNLFEHIVEPYDSAHGNVSEWNNEAAGSGNYIYNNLIRNTTAAVTMWVCPDSSSLQDYYFNNVIYATNAQQWDFANSGGAGCVAGGTSNFVNNTWVSGQIGTSGSYLAKYDSNYNIATTILGTPTSQTNQIASTTTQATTYGYLAANNYAPVNNTCNSNSGAATCPVGRGTNLTAACTAIGGTVGAALCQDTTLGPNYDAVNHRVNGNARTPVARPTSGAWDAGAFQSAAAVVINPFAGLSTSQADLTGDANHTSWYTPNATAGQPGTYSGPAYGGTKVDITFGTTVHRPLRPTDCGPSIGPCSTTTHGWNLIYSKVDPWSRDNSRWLVEDDSGWLYVFDATVEPYSFRERIQVDATTNAFATDGNDLATDFSNAVWCKTLGCGNKLFYTGAMSDTATGKNALKVWDEASKTSTVVHNFTSTIASFPGCTNIDSKREGNQSDDDRYWFFDCVDGNGADYGAITYDMQADAVIATKPYTAGGLCGVGACPTIVSPTVAQANWTGVCGVAGGTPYFVMNSNYTASTPQSLTRGHGTEVFDKNLNFLGWADIGNSHADCGLTTDGKMVYVTTPYAPFRYDSNAIAITDLAAISTSVPTGNSWAGERVIGLPCIWNYSGAAAGCPTDPSNSFRAQPYTISMRGSHGAQQGAMMFSSFEADSQMEGNSGGWGTNENIIIMLNYATAYTTPGDGVGNYPVGTFYRVGWTHAVHAQSRGGDDIGDYFAQADATCNWDCTKVAFTSTADIDNGTGGVTDAELPVGQTRHMALYVNLPMDAPTLSTITVTPTPSTTIIGGTITANAACAYTNGATTPCNVVWTDTNNHSSINSTTGIVTGVSLGTDTITATINSIFGTATVTITTPPPFYPMQSAHVLGRIN